MPKKVAKEATKKVAAKIAPKKSLPPPPKQSIRQLSIPSVADINQPPTELLEYAILIYGRKGIGKSSAIASFPEFLSYSWEPRRRNVALRAKYLTFKKAEAIVADMEAFEADPERYYAEHDGWGPDPWVDFQYLVSLAVEDSTVKGIAMDSVDITFEACQESHCARKGIDNPGQLKDYGATWNEIKHDFTATFRVAGDMGLSLLFISHAKEREQEFMEGVEGVTLVGPSCAASCMKIMKQLCDFWMYYGYNESKRCVWVNDPSSSLDVAAGNGFIDSNGERINKVFIPEDLEPNLFYESLNQAYKGTTTSTKKKRPVRKLSN